MDPPAAARIATTARRVERLSGTLATRAQQRMAEALPWFEALPPLPRSQVGLLVQAGIRGFADWMRKPQAGPTISLAVFDVAPRELTRVVTLEQVVELVRIAVDVTEAAVEEFASADMEVWAREAVLRYSRDIAFAAAQVYARAAEQRGAWDARLEALVVDAIVRGDVSDALLSRASALGWHEPSHVFVLAGAAPDGDTERSLAQTRRLGREAGADILTGMQTGRLLVVAGVAGRTSKVTRALLPAFAPGPVVTGPVVHGLVGAAHTVQDVFAGLRAVAGYPDAGRPVAAEDLLPERALAGDARAGRQLVTAIHHRLAAEEALLSTVDAYVASGGSIEATARSLFVHPNTVRYRLRRIEEVCGYDITGGRDRYVVQVALTLGRIDGGKDL
ncbi:MAG TPA: helix-turn-helix domain-containing protein [Mycobacteriales bacterium]|nr:helix-turn-helix domain-containing protein [Mycobacteriales bacterium]